MREIKFRAWLKWKGEMWDCNSSIGETDESLNEYIKETKDIVFMQYTGLKDKNDKEIYEGDIVKTVYGETYPVAFVVDVVSEHDGDYEEWFCGFFLGDGYTGLSGDDEIIGNIYENPELEVK